MATESKRGCGYRKAGGIYVVGDGIGEPVDWMPFCIDYPFAQGLLWALPERLFRTVGPLGEGILPSRWLAPPKVGLIWIGKKHYSDPAEFVKEAMRQGVSRRLGHLPVGLKPGTPIALAHVNAIHAEEFEFAKPEDLTIIQSPHCAVCSDVPGAKAIVNASIVPPHHRRKSPVAQIGGVFYLFHARAVEVVLPESVAARPEIQHECQKQGVVIVAVPDNDRDHVVPGWKLPQFLRKAAGEPELPLDDRRENQLAEARNGVPSFGEVRYPGESKPDGEESQCFDDDNQTPDDFDEFNE